MPPDFPVAPYEAIFEILQPHAGAAADAYREFSTGWSALTWRYAAVAEHDEAFTESFRVDAGATGSREVSPGGGAFHVLRSRHLRARDVRLRRMGDRLGDRQSGVRALNSRRPTASLTSVTLRMLRAAFAAEPMAVALRRVLDSEQFSEWTDVHNALTHRGGPGRHHHLHLPGDVRSTEWGGMELDEQTTASRRPWLSSTLNDLLTAIGDVRTRSRRRSVSRSRTVVEDASFVSFREQGRFGRARRRLHRADDWRKNWREGAANGFAPVSSSS